MRERGREREKVGKGRGTEKEGERRESVFLKS